MSVWSIDVERDAAADEIGSAGIFPADRSTDKRVIMLIGAKDRRGAIGHVPLEFPT